jgi:SAM-dependent methyltransferase
VLECLIKDWVVIRILVNLAGDKRDRFQIHLDMFSKLGLGKPVVADIGCGKPAISDFLNHDAIKIDCSGGTKPNIVADVSKGIPLERGSVDVCIAGDVIEHIPESKKFLSEVRRVLKSGGYLLISVPNAVSLRRRFGWMMGKVPATAARSDSMYDDNQENNPYMGHVRDYNIEDMKKLLVSNGFGVMSVDSTGIYTGSGRRIIPKWLLPKTFGDEIVFLAMKKTFKSGTRQ